MYAKTEPTGLNNGRVTRICLYICNRFTCPEIRFSLPVLLERFYFFADSLKNKDFEPVKNESPYFCARQQKKKGTARKESVKIIAFSGHINRLMTSNFGSLNLPPHCHQLCTNGLSMGQNLRIVSGCLLTSGIFEYVFSETC